MMNNVPYIEGMYRQWQSDHSAVAAEWDAYFRSDAESKPPLPKSAELRGAADLAYRQSRVDSLLWAYRDIGYLYAHLNPLGEHGPEHDYLRRGSTTQYEKLTLEDFGIPPDSLDMVFSAGRAMKPSKAPLREIIEAFRETYCGSIGVEFLHIQDKNIRHWLINKMESCRNKPSLDDSKNRIILEDLLRTEALEHAMQQFFVGQKRFSLEGSEAIIPGLHFLVDSANHYEIEEFVIGTTHRGRLSILNTILHMSPEEIFSTFEENFEPGMYGGAGDVKYHIGYETDHKLDDGGTAHISVCANASHLESIDAIVEGKARALQDHKEDTERKHILPILLHGDAAFSGQGVVAETLNLSRLEGYRTGGTIHIVINNQIGFTTAARHARSSIFPTDAAKAFSVPIFHINGDDPEAFVYAADLALQFRQKFGSDCVLDVFCYRRHGHNEADDPSFTQPYMYRLIKDHPGTGEIYGKKCAESGITSEEQQAEITQKYAGAFKEALDRAREKPATHVNSKQGKEWANLDPRCSHEPVATDVPKAILEKIAGCLVSIPEDFHVHRSLERILTRKQETFTKESTVDWSLAESLAFGSLLLEGVPVRLSGEDCVRGTFSQRHLTWWDVESDSPRPYTPLANLSGDQAQLDAFDSPLSEYSILGFEYGYSLVNPNCLVAWEAQFGDFANGAQVIIDNYIASAESKWRRSSGLIMLLPHASEGQGPDHSSAHLERFLQLAADDNIQVCNLTTPAQYFHLLRRQVKAPFRKPLIIMTPKSLLRHPKTVSSVSDLETGSFQEVLDDTSDPSSINQILLCSGKVYYDLLVHREETKQTDAALIRIELLYPFPQQALAALAEKYANVHSIKWVQEEPRNAGAWTYMRERFSVSFPRVNLYYCGRDESPTSAPGSHKQYKKEQEELVQNAFK